MARKSTYSFIFIPQTLCDLNIMEKTEHVEEINSSPTIIIQQLDAGVRRQRKTLLTLSQTLLTDTPHYLFTESFL